MVVKWNLVVNICVHIPSTDVRDVWLSSKVVLYERKLIWKSKCPASNLNISASLCWRQHKHLCTAAPNSTLVEDGGGNQLVCLAGLLVESVMQWLIINAFSNMPVFSSTEIQFICCGQTPSDVCAGEKEPDVPVNGMCPVQFFRCRFTHSCFILQFSLKGSHHISCPFLAGESFCLLLW